MLADHSKTNKTLLIQYMSLNIEIVSDLNYTEISKIISQVLFDQFIFIKMFF